MGKVALLNRVQVLSGGWGGPGCEGEQWGYGGVGGLVVQWCWVKFQCQGILLIWKIVGQGPIALAVEAGEFGLFFLASIFSLFFLPLSGRRPHID